MQAPPAAAGAQGRGAPADRALAAGGALAGGQCAVQRPEGSRAPARDEAQAQVGRAAAGGRDAVAAQEVSGGGGDRGAAATARAVVELQRVPGRGAEDQLVLAGAGLEAGEHRVVSGEDGGAGDVVAGGDGRRAQLEHGRGQRGDALRGQQRGPRERRAGRARGGQQVASHDLVPWHGAGGGEARPAGERDALAVAGEAAQQRAVAAGPAGAEAVHPLVVDDEDVGAGLLEAAQDGGDRPGSQAVRRLHAPDVGPARGGDAGGAGRAEALVGARAEHPHARVARGEVVQEGAAVAGRAVVDGDELRSRRRPGRREEAANSAR